MVCACVLIEQEHGKPKGASPPRKYQEQLVLAGLLHGCLHFFAAGQY